MSKLTKASRLSPYIDSHAEPYEYELKHFRQIKTDLIHQLYTTDTSLQLKVLFKTTYTEYSFS